MDARTKKALEGSIRKWQRIVEWKGGDKGYEDCPLCSMFVEKGCVGCPVRERTGYFGCIGSPYVEWLDAWKDKSYYISGDVLSFDDCNLIAEIGQWVIGHRTQKAAEAMLAFLISLREG